MVKLFVCLECKNIFEDPKKYVEKHGLDSGPYEEWDGCPECSGSYTEAQLCDCCGYPITTDEYIKTEDGERFCEDCFTYVKLGDE